MTKLLVVALAVGTFKATPMHGQGREAADVVGLLRGDGIVLPYFQRVDSGWVPTRGPGLSEWSSVGEYHLRGPDGWVDIVSAGAALLLWDAYDEWGHLTDAGQMGTGSTRVAYVVSRPVGHAPFSRTTDGPSIAAVSLLFDSLAPIPGTSESSIGVSAWQAELDGASESVFFAATRQARGTGDAPCFTITGVATSSGTLQALHSSGYDFCDGMQRTPWALLRREQELSIFVSTRGSDDLGVELWSYDREAHRWYVALEVNNSGHSMMGVPGR